MKASDIYFNSVEQSTLDNENQHSKRMRLDFGAKYKIISQFFSPCSNFSESLMSSDKNKPDKKAEKIIEGAPPENNYRLSLIHALGVKES